LITICSFQERRSSMRGLLKGLLLSLAAVAVTGCASGPSYSKMDSSIPALGTDMGRIYFYRTAVLGMAIQPNVLLNGEKVGTAVPKGFFYVDRAPGEYQVVTETEVKRKLSFVIEKGRTRYVKLNISMGFFVGRVYGELVEEEKALKDLKSCKYVGKGVSSQ
jgi:hypothetical protein